MLQIADYGAKLLSHIAIAADKLSLGLLMDPEEVVRTVAPRYPDAVSNRWWVCGNLHRGMFAAAQAAPLRHLGKVILTPQGTKYLVLAQQAGAWQHRLMLQLAGRQMRDFLAASLDIGFELSLGCAGEEEGLLVQDCRFVSALLGEMDLQRETVPRMSPHLLRKEACMVASSLLSPSEVCVEELQVPHHVCVSIVASDELVAAVMESDRPDQGN
ncbi:hypothetical protein GCM10028796_25130 [Ramlibacter monticola]|uniref:Uncharacterized protein n=1 Tax=Ramlibacter monticola TaxID=1926872 RepID=A0A936Z1S3_9BURK|nr:hypothetical protein [Ramlibacter monticola]MBL0392757.1 hypothetical protein [Ramlibacter monticola]